jgi:HSP20 family protein
MLERIDPFRNLQFVHDALSRVFDDQAYRLDATRGTSWVPAVDVYEDVERLAFRFDVPGVKKEDLHVRVENGVLTVEGKRAFESEKTRENYHRIERSFGQFARSFSLPSTVSSERVDAELRDGVLNVTLTKKPEAQRRTIDIKVA